MNPRYIPLLIIVVLVPLGLFPTIFGDTAREAPDVNANALPELHGPGGEVYVLPNGNAYYTSYDGLWYLDQDKAFFVKPIIDENALKPFVYSDD